MDSSIRTLGSLRAFRNSFYRCFDRRADALFELTDALLTAGTVPSPFHLSLAPVHRRGWGSLYAALSRGRIDEVPLRDLLARRHLAGDGERPSVYAVDVSVWSRCDAETSPGRGYYYHPSRHSAGQPIVAGWAYQLVAQLGFDRDSWVAPVDARRVKPTENADEVAAEQGCALVQRLPQPQALPIFVFDAFSTIRSNSSTPWKGAPHGSSCGCTPTGSSTPPRRRSSRSRWAVRAATARSSTSKIPQAGRSLLASTAAKVAITARCASGAGWGCTPRPGA